LFQLQGRIVFRVDGNSRIGLGHIVRCTALAEILEPSYQCVFCMKEAGGIEVESLVNDFKCWILPESTDRDEELDLLRSKLIPTDFLVLDGYHFDTAYQQAIKLSVCKMICVDDLAEIHFHADVIINHAAPEVAKRYSKEKNTSIFAGPDYVLLRAPFRLAAKKQARTIDHIHTVFICMGGADPFNVTNKILQILFQVEFVKRIIVVTGNAYRFQQEMRSVCASAPDEKEVMIENGVSAERMVELIGLSQLAICTGSSVSFEVASVKCGMVTGTVIDNQEILNEMLVTTGCSENAGDLTKISAEHLKQIIDGMKDIQKVNMQIRNQSILIDGLSDNRIRGVFNSLETC
jgi:UDP-2,4-diacetamido-2,4,6-trideoxy-beta-L-altropyranose hydrolase